MNHHKVNAKLPKGWQKGAPPHVGWWRTKDYGIDSGEWRFFNGTHWSIFCDNEDRFSDPLRAVQYPSAYSYADRIVEWRADWPKKARVARVNPQTGECTGAGPCPYETAGMAWPFKKGGKK